MPLRTGQVGCLHAQFSPGTFSLALACCSSCAEDTATLSKREKSSSSLLESLTAVLGGIRPYLLLARALRQ